jgi:hypothetical protein
MIFLGDSKALADTFFAKCCTLHVGAYDIWYLGFRTPLSYVSLIFVYSCLFFLISFILCTLVPRSMTRCFLFAGNIEMISS